MGKRLRGRAWSSALVTGAWLVACGGSAQISDAGSAGATTLGGSSAAGAMGKSGAGGAAGDVSAGAAGAGCDVGCAGPTGSCAGGYHYGLAPGDCCASCIPNSTDNCVQGESNYQDYRETQLNFNDSCQTDADCVLVYEQNACTDGCGIPVSTSMSAGVVTKLNAYAEKNCATCPPPTPPPCAQFKVSCTMGACVIASP